MFEMAFPWWHFVARGALVYGALLLLVRLSGKRTVGEFTPFDLVVVVLLGEAVQGGLTGGDESVGGGLVGAATLVALNYALGFWSARSDAVDRLVEGRAEVLIRRGRVLLAAARRNNIPFSDLREAIRRAGLVRVRDVRLATLETDGEITVVPWRGR